MAKKTKVPEPAKEREVKMTVAVGMPRTGKTVELIKIYEKLAEIHAVVLFDFSNESKYKGYPVISSTTIKTAGDQLPKGIYRFASKDVKRSLVFFGEYLRNAVLVFEDATSYVPANLPDYLVDLVSIRSQRGLDLFFVFHALRMIPPRIATLCNYILIKKTGDSLKKLKNLESLPYPEKVINAWKKVQADPNPFAFRSVRVN